MQNEQEPMALPWSVMVTQPRALIERAIKPSVLSIGSFLIRGPNQNQGSSRYHIYGLGATRHASHDLDDPDRDPYEPREPWMRDTRVCVLTVSSEGTTTRLAIESPANHGSAEVFLYAFAAAMRQRGIPIDRTIDCTITNQEEAPAVELVIPSSDESQAVDLFNTIYMQEKRQDRVKNIEEWLRLHDIPTSRRNFYNWRKKYSQ